MTKRKYTPGHNNNRIEGEILILGSGAAGLTTALFLLEAGHDVILATKGNVMESNTANAQGGIVTLGPKDSSDLLVKDIETAGEGLVFPDAARIVAEEGPPLVQSLLAERLKVPFAIGPQGFDYTQEGGHSRRRILHVDDATGEALATALSKAVLGHPRLLLLDHHTAVDVITSEHHSKNPLSVYAPNRCLGAYLLDRRQGAIRTVLARAIIMATGGCGRVYLHTTNPPEARGDGLAMAYRAGLPIINAEYVQFHPTSLFHRDEGGFLITESLRGEGARLLTKDGQPFMERYHPMGDLAPRDVVSTAIAQEMVGRGDSYVLLDATEYRGKIPLADRFPTVFNTCKRLGINISVEPIPVVPAAHYFCGGVKVDMASRTGLAGLWAVGEVACTGLHGANRLASTSLLEGLVFGQRCAESIHRHLADSDSPIKEWGDIPDWQAPAHPQEADPALIIQDGLLVRSTMWNYAGILRTRDRLRRAQSDLNYLRHRVEKFYREKTMADNLIGLRNLIQVAMIIIQAAVRNPTSRGCHFISDNDL